MRRSARGEMDDTTVKSGITKLGQDNYHIWSVQTMCWLGSKDLIQWIKQKPVDGEDGLVPATDRAADSKALHLIGMTLTEEHHTLFEECETAMEAWEALANLFKNKSQARRLQLKTEMSNLRMETGDSVGSKHSTFEPTAKFLPTEVHFTMCYSSCLFSCSVYASL